MTMPFAALHESQVARSGLMLVRKIMSGIQG
jgi:hypothetical protein